MTHKNILLLSGGWNSNPTAVTFASTYRKILYRCGVTPSLQGNVRPQDGTDLLRHDNDGDDNTNLYVQPTTSLTLYLDDTIEYISGWIARHLQQRVKCIECALALTSSEPFPSDGRLLNIKDRGLLIAPNSSITRICKVAETVFRAKSRWGIEYIVTVYRKLYEMNLFLTLQNHHRDTLNGIDSHVTSLIRLIINTYFNIRQHHKTKLKNVDLHRQMMRRTYTTIIHSHLHQ